MPTVFITCPVLHVEPVVVRHALQLNPLVVPLQVPLRYGAVDGHWILRQTAHFPAAVWDDPVKY